MSDDSQPKIFLIATPIGNLGDITLRALEILNEVDYVACEDTRKTGIFLKHFNIKKPLFSFFEHNEDKALEKIVNLVDQGNKIALVTNAGTPGISDPGFTVVRRMQQLGIPITMVPGPTALIMGLVLSGLPTHSFTFRGFPPRKKGPRQRFLALDIESSHTLIFYESPHRLIPFLNDLLTVYGNRQACIANDLTKRYETIMRGQIIELIENLQETKLLGEYLVIVEGLKQGENS